MKNLLILAVLIVSLSSISQYAKSDILVIANTNDQSLKLSRQEIRNLFMGGALPYDLTAVALPPENQTRVLFNTKVVGLTEARIQSYWAQMRFTGRKIPPKELENEQLLIEYLLSHQGTVAYLSSDIELPPKLTILYRVSQ